MPPGLKKRTFCDEHREFEFKCRCLVKRNGVLCPCGVDVDEQLTFGCADHSESYVEGCKPCVDAIIPTAIIRMMKHMGSNVHKEIEKHATPLTKEVELTKALKCPGVYFRRVLNKDQYSCHKQMQLRPKLIWEMYMDVMNGARQNLYVLHQPTDSKMKGGKWKISKCDTDTFNYRQFKTLVDKLFGVENMI